MAKDIERHAAKRVATQRCKKWIHESTRCSVAVPVSMLRLKEARSRALEANAEARDVGAHTHRMNSNVMLLAKLLPVGAAKVEMRRVYLFPATETPIPVTDDERRRFLVIDDPKVEKKIVTP